MLLGMIDLHFKKYNTLKKTKKSCVSSCSRSNNWSIYVKKEIKLRDNRTVAKIAIGMSTERPAFSTIKSLVNIEYIKETKDDRILNKFGTYII